MSNLHIHTYTHIYIYRYILMYRSYKRTPLMAFQACSRRVALNGFGMLAFHEVRILFLDGAIQGARQE